LFGIIAPVKVPVFSLFYLKGALFLMALTGLSEGQSACTRFFLEK